MALAPELCENEGTPPEWMGPQGARPWGSMPQAGFTRLPGGWVLCWHNRPIHTRLHG